jgi:hypothetical protein
MSRAREVSKIVSNNFSTTPPILPFVGQMWTDTTNPLQPALKVYNGIEWISVSSASSGGGMATTLMTIGAS